MNIFQTIYQVFVYEPQLNLLQFIFNFTQDTGLSIIIIAIIANILMLPLHISSYINIQKTRLLQPKMKKLREKYKDDPQKYFQEITAFNKQHGISNSSTFVTLLVQLFFISGLFVLVRDVVDKKDFQDNLYPFVADLDVEFTTKAFDFLPLDVSASEYIWLPLLAAFFSFLYGYYVSKLAPKIKLKEESKEKPKNKETEVGEKMFDPEAFQKSMEFNTTFLMPVILFFFNYNFSVGLNLYLVTSTFLSLIRYIFISQYYNNHIESLKQQIESSDPIFQDSDPDNDYNIVDVQEKPAKKPKTNSKNPYKKKKASKKNKAKKSKSS